MSKKEDKKFTKFVNEVLDSLDADPMVRSREVMKDDPTNLIRIPRDKSIYIYEIGGIDDPLKLEIRHMNEDKEEPTYTRITFKIGHGMYNKYDSGDIRISLSYHIAEKYGLLGSPLDDDSCDPGLGYSPFALYDFIPKEDPKLRTDPKEIVEGVLGTIKDFYAIVKNRELEKRLWDIYFMYDEEVKSAYERKSERLKDLLEKSSKNSNIIDNEII